MDHIYTGHDYIGTNNYMGQNYIGLVFLATNRPFDLDEAMYRRISEVCILVTLMMV